MICQARPSDATLLLLFECDGSAETLAASYGRGVDHVIIP